VVKGKFTEYSIKNAGKKPALYVVVMIIIA